MNLDQVHEPARRANRLPRGARAMAQVLIDVPVLAAALFLSYALRFNFEIRADTYEYLWQQLPLVVGLQMTALWLAGARAASWRYISLAELPSFLQAAIYWTVPLGALRFLLDESTQSIVQLAEKMIRLSGFEPYEDIDIVFTGASPGEKLAEELAHTSEELQPTANPKIFVGTIPSLDPERVRGGMERLHELIDLGDDAGLRRFLNELLPEARLEAPACAEGS